MTVPYRGIAVPCFGNDPSTLIDLACDTEAAGFDGFFLWDHMLFANDGDGPPILDPWSILAVIATKTRHIKMGTIITPVSRRRPWVLARQTTTIDRISNGRLILGVGIGSPERGDFELFGEASSATDRATKLDEGLHILNGLWSGTPFSFAGKHFRLQTMRFTPTPRQRPRIPIWVGGVLPAPRPMRRAAHWDGAVPVRFHKHSIATPSVHDIAAVADQVRRRRGSLEGYELVVWATVQADSDTVQQSIDEYADAGATWWIETAKPEPNWLIQVSDRVRRGP